MPAARPTGLGKVSPITLVGIGAMGRATSGVVPVR